MTVFTKISGVRPVWAVLAVLALSACNMDSMTPRGGHKADTAEQLLQAEGSWAMVEENPGSDPAALHRAAKNQVNPADMKNKQFLPDQDLKLARNDKAAGGQDVNYRLIRVERDVQSLRDDFRKLLPPLSNLIVADKNLDRTIADIEAKNAIEPAAGPVSGTAPVAMAAESRQAGAMPKATGAPMRMASSTMPAPAPVAPQAAIKPAAPMAAASAPAPAPAIPSGSASVSNIRLGEHPGKTRLVLDLSGPSPYSTELDNTEKLLIVQIPKAGWSAGQGRTLGKSPLVASYTAQPASDGGTTLAIELKRPVKIAADSSLPPNATYQNHRIFLDLVAL